MTKSIKIIEGFDAITDAFPDRPVALTIGNFDGCHIGHQILVRETVRRARDIGGLAGALTFDMHPQAFLGAPTHERLLFTHEQKVRALAELGLDFVVVQAFDESFRHVTREAFVEHHLAHKLRVAFVVVGDNFRFGYERRGDVPWLASYGPRWGVEVTALSAEGWDDAVVSSSRVRAAVREVGEMDAVTSMLGRPYMLEGVIVRGDRIGRSLGVPTANLGDVRQIVPAYGVYAGHILMRSDSAEPFPVTAAFASPIPAVFSVGVRPSIRDGEAGLRVEAHLLEGQYGEDALYGYRAAYAFTHRIREERKYPDLESLKTQMTRDIASARRALGLE